MFDGGPFNPMTGQVFVLSKNCVGVDMNVKDFVQGIRKTVVEENTEIYRDLFENTESATDAYFIRALSLYHSLDDEQRKVFLEVTRQVSIDAVSSLFAILDGVTPIEGQAEEIRVVCGDEELSGELQDAFLGQFED